MLIPSTWKIPAAVFVGLSSVTLSVAGQVNLLINGSFESPAVSPPYQTDGLPYYYYVRTDTPPPGWSQIGSQWPILVSRPGGWIASDGNQFTEIESCCGVSIAQTFATTIGFTYTVSYDYAAQPGVTSNDDSIRVLINGFERDYYDGVAGSPGPLEWTTRTFAFVATSSVTELRFADGLVGTSYIGPLLDNVTVTAVPEPSGALLALAGLGVLSILARRKQGEGDGRGK